MNTRTPCSNSKEEEKQDERPNVEWRKRDVKPGKTSSLEISPKAHRDGKRREAEVQPLPEVRDPKEERDTWKDEWIKRSGVFGENEIKLQTWQR